MIRNKRKLDEFYHKLDAEEELSHKQALAIYGALHKEAVALGGYQLRKYIRGIRG